MIIQQIMKSIAVEFKIDINELHPDLHLINDLGLDSLDLAYFWYDIEADFHILIPDTFKLSTIQNLAAMIEEISNGSKVSYSTTDFQPIEVNPQNYFYSYFDTGI